MSGLSNSRHAPWHKTHPQYRSNTSAAPPPPLTITPATSASYRNAPSSGPLRINVPSSLAAYELDRYTKIVRRLKWKYSFLATAYQYAIDRTRGRDPTDVAEAELMFKLDFFEYYMLIERALVHLLGVFGISISRGIPTTTATLDYHNSMNANGLGLSNGNGRIPSPDKPYRDRSDHRYHANVLEALDSLDNPLHAALGTGEVRRQLSRAKDLRNRWKTAGEEEKDEQRGRAKLTAPLETYDLERILMAIFAGFDAAYLVAEQAVRMEAAQSGSAGVGWDVDMAGHAVGERGSEEEQWEFMVDAMDWEAV